MPTIIVPVSDVKTIFFVPLHWRRHAINLWQHARQPRTRIIITARGFQQTFRTWAHTARVRLVENWFRLHGIKCEQPRTTDSYGCMHNTVDTAQWRKYGDSNGCTKSNTNTNAPHVPRKLNMPVADDVVSDEIFNKYAKIWQN